MYLGRRTGNRRCVLLKICDPFVALAAASRCAFNGNWLTFNWLSRHWLAFRLGQIFQRLLGLRSNPGRAAFCLSAIILPEIAGGARQNQVVDSIGADPPKRPASIRLPFDFCLVDTLFEDDAFGIVRWFPDDSDTCHLAPGIEVGLKGLKGRVFHCTSLKTDSKQSPLVTDSQAVFEQLVGSLFGTGHQKSLGPAQNENHRNFPPQPLIVEIREGFFRSLGSPKFRPVAYGHLTLCTTPKTPTAKACQPTECTVSR